jgi:putative endonuclease
MFTVYVLRSRKSGVYYVGQTNNLADRVRRHNANTERATRLRGPWELVYWEEFETRAEAWKREQEIKAQKHRAYIESLIATQRGVAQPG